MRNQRADGKVFAIAVTCGLCVSTLHPSPAHWAACACIHNLAGYAGACLQPPDNCWLLCEYLSGGTLSQWLHGDRLAGGR
jgi:hypothetical protein